MTWLAGSVMTLLGSCTGNHFSETLNAGLTQHVTLAKDAHNKFCVHNLELRV